jgi:hypothetical protein
MHWLGPVKVWGRKHGVNPLLLLSLFFKSSDLLLQLDEEVATSGHLVRLAAR